MKSAPLLLAALAVGCVSFNVEFEDPATPCPLEAQVVFKNVPEGAGTMLLRDELTEILEGENTPCFRTVAVQGREHTVGVGPVPDPQALAKRIRLGRVLAVRGRLIEVDARRLR